MKYEGEMGRLPKVMKNAEECRQACINSKDCAGFTFVKTAIYKHNCAIKKKWSPASRRTSKCCDSGQVTDSCRQGNRLFAKFEC